VLCVVDLEEVVEQPEVHRVRVAHRVRRRRRPREQRLAEQRREDRPEVGAVERPLAPLQRPVGGACHHRHRLAAHLPRLPVDQVGRGRARHELELERREAERGRDRVAPRQPARVADQHQRDAEQRRARHVQLPGQRELRLVEALRPVPREVRVAEQQALAVAGRRLAERDRVGAEVAERQALAQRRQLAGQRQWRRRQRCRRRRRLRARDPLDRHARARQQRELVEAPVDVELGDRPHPRRAAAARVGQPVDPGLAQVVVVARHIAGDAGADLRPRAVRRRLLQQALDHPVVVQALEEEVRVEVVRPRAVAAARVAPVGAEVARALGAHGHVRLGDLAQVVLCERVAVAVAQALVGARLDVRDPVRRAADLDVWGGDRRRGAREQENEGDSEPHHRGKSYRPRRADAPVTRVTPGS
jgi:hypothetical protein